jgi:hypothetical protein
VSTVLELSGNAKERLRALEALSEKAEGGDKSARKELRKAVRESAPEVISRASDIGRRGRWVLIKTIARDPLTEEALLAQLDTMHADVAGPDPSPLEVLLTERICSLWLLIEVLECLVSAQLSSDLPKEQRTGMSFLRDILKWQESASRRYLAALKTLAQVRKLQSGIPGSQTNVQINLSAAQSGSQQGEEPNS